MNPKPVNGYNAVINPKKQRGEPCLGPDAIMVAIPSDLQYIVDLSRAERATQGKSSPFKLFIIKKGKGLPCGLAGPLLWSTPRGDCHGKAHSIGCKKDLGDRVVWFIAAKYYNRQLGHSYYCAI